MKAEDAQKLLPGAKVWVTYTPTTGHGGPINGPGVVTHAGPAIHKNIHGTEYTWVTVRMADKEFVCPSHSIAGGN